MENNEKRSRFALVRMIRGLAQPTNTRAYKEARIALERLSAPIVAVLIPVLAAVVLAVVTAMRPRTVSIMEVQFAELDVDDPPETDPPPPIDDAATPTDDVTVDISLPDTPVSTEVVVPEPTAVTTAAPVKDLSNTVLPVVSPVCMKRPSGYGVRSQAARSKHLGPGAEMGNGITEGSVLKALRWLKHTQRPDGSWAGPSPTAMTGLAVLTYLAHGETPTSREFGGTVGRALDYLIASQREENGVTRFRGSDGNEYAFLIATYALCEAYGMTRNPNAGEAARKGLARIIAGQSPTGGWDYKLNRASTRDDLSFGGWALQAVKAGKMADLHVDGLDECVKRSVRYLKTRAFRKGGFGYCAGNAPSGLTATGCLALQLLGLAREKEVRSALDFMRAWGPVWENHPGGRNAQYYSYYATQCKYQAGMRENAAPADKTSWKKWNAEMKAAYPSAMTELPERIPDTEGRPCAMGYWQNHDAYNAPVMSTCLCALQLMVYYRYLPTSSLRATEIAPDVQSLVKDRTDEIVPVIDI